MITVYSADTDDFTTNGLAVLRPTSCTVTETLNGEYELELTHVIDSEGKWSRLQVGNILRVPVPMATTPAITAKATQSSGTGSSTGSGSGSYDGNEIWKVVSTVYGLNMRAGPGTHHKEIKGYLAGTEIQVLAKDVNGTWWYECMGPDGTRGYMSSHYLEYVRTESSASAAAQSVTVAAHQLREQPFRIYKTEPSLTEIKVYARHIFYDLMDNMVEEYKPSGKVTGSAAAAAVLNGCSTEHDFSLLSNITKKADELDYEFMNPVEIFMGDGGLIEKYTGEILRDWYDVFFINRVGKDTSVTLHYGRDITGITCETDVSNVVTRIIPQGEDKDGNPIYLPEKYIDSTHINDYPHPKYSLYQVSEAKESDGKDKDTPAMTKEQVIEKLRSSAQEEMDKGCDLPDITINVDFINITDTEEYKDYNQLNTLFLGDGVKVIVEKLGIATSLRMTSYEYDCLLKRYTKCTLGKPDEGLSSQLVSAAQIASGSISGTKLALGSIGTGQLQSGAVSSAKIQAAAITSAHIQNGVITNAHIQDASIDTAKIADAAVTSAKIGSAEIKETNIDTAAVTSAKIKDLAVTAGKIASAAITSAKIASAAIETAHISNGAVDTAKIADAAITSAKIGVAAITDAHIADASISSAKIRDLQTQVAIIAQAEIEKADISAAQIADLSAQVASIVTATIQNADIDWASIADLTADIANIAAAQVSSADIGFAQVKDLVTGQAIITEGEAGKLFISRLAVDAMQVVSAITNELVVKGADGKYYKLTIQNGQVVPVQEQLDGGQIAANSINGSTAIVEHSITASELNATSIFADEAIIRALSAGIATFGQIFAESGIVPFLETSIINGNGALKLKVDALENNDTALANKNAEIEEDIAQLLLDTNGIHLSVNEVQNNISSLNTNVSALRTSVDTIDESKITSYAQPDEPTENLHTGDIWLNTSDKNTLYRYNGSEWEMLQDSSITDMASSINALNDQINSCVSKTDYYNDTDELRRTVQSTIDQRVDSVTATFETSLQGVIDDTTGKMDAVSDYVATMIRADGNGISIGKTDSDFSTVIDNQKMAFKDGETEVASISNKKLNITSADVSEELTIGGKFVWKDTARGIEFKYIG